MRGSDYNWNGVCGVPGIGTSVQNIYKEPSSLWGDKQEAIREATVRTKLINAFKSKKWKRKTKECDSKIKSPFTFPKLKVIKDDQTLTFKQFAIKDRERVAPPKNQSYWKNSLRRVKSLPAEKPASPWQVLQVLQTNNNQPNSKQSISRGTQTDLDYEHRKLRRSEPRVSFSEESPKTEKSLQKSKHIYRDIEYSDTDSEQGCNLEVFQTLKEHHEDPIFQDELLIKRQLELNSITPSEMISPTLIMTTEMDTDTDTDSDDDDEDTVNIYEEVLNQDNYRGRQHISRLSTTSSLYSSDIQGVGCHQQQNYFLSSNKNKFLAKKKLSRSTKSNPASNIYVTHHPCEKSYDYWVDARSTKMDKKTKGQGRKKTLSEKFSKLVLHSFGFGDVNLSKT